MRREQESENPGVQAAPERLPLRRTQVGIGGGLLVWAVALACWLIVAAANGYSVPELMPEIPELVLFIGPWTFPGGCVLALIALRRVGHFHSLLGFLLELAGVAAAVGAATGAVYGMKAGPLYPKGWALVTGVPALLLIPIGTAIGWYLWRRRGSSPAAEPAAEERGLD
jgi:hypothetical protein